jgi:hypothetical protein
MPPCSRRFRERTPSTRSRSPSAERRSRDGRGNAPQFAWPSGHRAAGRPRPTLAALRDIRVPAHAICTSG